MNKEHTAYLFNKYPEFFKNKEDLKQSLMGFGFECDDGWFDLIRTLCQDIEEYFLTEYEGIGYNDEKYYHEIPEHFSVQQVKEKFGGLRFYISSAPQAVHDLIHIAEHKSYYICESCGDDLRKKKYNDGQYHSYYRDELGWVKTYCDECLKKEIKRVGLKDSDYISDWQKEHNAPYVEVEV